MIALPRRTLIGLLLLGALVIALRLPFFAVPLITDEGAAAYVAHFWSSDHQLYRDINYDRLQGFFLAYKMIFALLGEDVVALRVGVALYSVGTMAAIFLLARQLLERQLLERQWVGPAAAWIAGLLFAVFGTAPAIEGFTANAEHFAILPLTLAAGLTWNKRWGWAGVCSGIAIAFKPIGLSAVLLLLIWLFVQRAGARAAVRAAIGTLIVPVAAIVHGAIIGWEHFWRVFVENRLLAHSVIGSSPLTQLHNWWSSVQYTGLCWIPLLSFALIALLQAEKPLRNFALLWLGTSLVGMSLGGEWHSHYYVQLIPPLCVLAGAGMVYAWRQRSTLSLALSAGGVAGLIAFALMQGPYWTLSPLDISARLFRRPEYLVADTVAAHIQQNTASTDTIYVAFCEAEIYFLAQRRAAVPQQLFCRQLEHNPALWQSVVRSLHLGEPRMVFWTRPPPRWGSNEEFAALLGEHYTLDRQFGQMQLFRRR